MPAISAVRVATGPKISALSITATTAQLRFAVTSAGAAAAITGWPRKSASSVLPGTPSMAAWMVGS